MASGQWYTSLYQADNKAENLKKQNQLYTHHDLWEFFYLLFIWNHADASSALIFPCLLTMLKPLSGFISGLTVTLFVDTKQTGNGLICAGIGYPPK